MLNYILLLVFPDIVLCKHNLLQTYQIFLIVPIWAFVFRGEPLLASEVPIVASSTNRLTTISDSEGKN